MKRPISLVLLLLALAAGAAGCDRTGTTDGGATTPGGQLELSRSALVFNAGGRIPSDTRTLRLSNTGAGALSVSALTLGGADAAQFALSQTGPFELAASESLELTVTFTPVPGDLGPQRAALRVMADGAPADVALGGLSVAGQEGTREPSLQWILDTYGLPIATGDRDPTNSALTDGVVDGLVGEEVAAQAFRRADPAQPVSVKVIAAFGVPDVEPVFEFGVYDASAAQPQLQRLLRLPISPYLNGQRLEPVIETAGGAARGPLSFEPPAETFGFYSFWPTTRFFQARTVYTQDAHNTFAGAAPHHVRAYPLRAPDGTVVAGAFVLATDESVRLFDFNDAVVIVRNVAPLP